MKKLVLEATLRKKLGRLKNKVGDLHYLGIDPNELASQPTVAIVGTRKITPYGKQVTEKLAAELVRAGVVVVSGLAFGVDITAHKAALEAGGQTVAVLPSGLQNIYPASHARYAGQIKRKGSVISEYAAKHKPQKFDFLERNRLIAALSDAVIIPEAAEHSGSLNTAKHATDIGIPVAAVPGPITSPLSSGTNWLIKQGAHLITSADDVLTLLNIDKKAAPARLVGSNDLETAVLLAIANQIHDAALIAQKVGADIEDFQAALTGLEISGRIHQDGTGTWHLN